ncbi:MAG TPA: fumarylacetoacetate hydrolase family protein [Acidimicrobiia bacterium]|nr:fumarylacetoacetate hydrolase family protein [Acidimicrobiia bacterium]
MTLPDLAIPGVRRGIEEMLVRRAQVLAQGAKPIGWKLGFGAPAWLDKFGLTGPLVGFLTDATRYPSGAAVSCEGWSNPVAEPEIAVHIGPEAVDPDHAGAAIDVIGPAIELADVHSPPEDIAEVLAGNIFHRALVLGETASPRAGGVLAGLRARIVCDGVEVADTTDLEVLTGGLVAILGHAATLLASAGEAIRPGEVVIMGSVIPPQPVRPGQVVSFELSPISTVSVSV